MFSSKDYLERKTGPDGVDRFNYLQALVTEYQDTEEEGMLELKSVHSNPLPLQVWWPVEDSVAHVDLGFDVIIDM